MKTSRVTLSREIVTVCCKRSVKRVCTRCVAEGRYTVLQTTEHTLLCHAGFGVPFRREIVLLIMQYLMTLGSSKYFKAVVLTF
jgi:hypothetical protein